ncbi:tetratricopeptide repeat protein [Deinococcus sp.]|uniref:tetratricopeptide repeat protein n=1 Tax=Deinococcus sp. TaxID=47478 RepID=UPI0025BB4AFD|nr:tetratricopeptide repeat protein [Deinococcus sp.]
MQPVLSLPELIGQGEWRRALATARAQGAGLDLEHALDTVLTVQVALRARRYPAARQAVAELTPLLPALPEPEGSALRAQVDPQALTGALRALEAGQKVTDPAELAALLHGALAGPLTRAEALNMQGILHAVSGEAEQARALLNAAMQADPGHYRALTNLGNLDMDAGQFAQAEAVYRRVLVLNPEYDGGHHNLGVALRRQGRVGEGVRSIRRGQQLSMKRSKEDTNAEMKEQFAQNPAMKALRWVLLAVVALIVFLAVRGVGS